MFDHKSSKRRSDLHENKKNNIMELLETFSGKYEYMYQIWREVVNIWGSKGMK